MRTRTQDPRRANIKKFISQSATENPYIVPGYLEPGLYVDLTGKRYSEVLSPCERLDIGVTAKAGILGGFGEFAPRPCVPFT